MAVLHGVPRHQVLRDIGAQHLQMAAVVTRQLLLTNGKLYQLLIDTNFHPQSPHQEKKDRDKNRMSSCITPLHETSL